MDVHELGRPTVVRPGSVGRPGREVKTRPARLRDFERASHLTELSLSSPSFTAQLKHPETDRSRIAFVESLAFYRQIHSETSAGIRGRPGGSGVGPSGGAIDDGCTPRSCRQGRNCSRTTALVVSEVFWYYFFFTGGAAVVGTVALTGAGLAPFFGFFFSLPCELSPLPITHLYYVLSEEQGLGLAPNGIGV